MKSLVAFLALCLTLLPIRAEAVQSPLRVVASFSILGDMVRQIGGDQVEVITLVGPDGDAHGYQPTPDDLKAVAKADIVFVNGLSFDGWMKRLAASSGYKGPIVVTTAGVKARELMKEGGDHHGHDHGATDPHAWQSLSNGVIYAENIAAGLSKVLPAQAENFAQRKNAYQEAMKALDADVKAQIGAVPAAQRLVITSHDAFGYFGAAYGIRFVAPYGMSTESEPSAKNVARLIDQIKKAGVREVFIENMSNPRLIEQLAKDAGATIGGTLYADALSAADGGAATYLDMFRSNVPKLVAAMRGGRTTP
ncbi:MAG: metal ABC transporter substrate-binding protein [Alphaproteobacteria bacterium]